MHEGRRLAYAARMKLVFAVIALAIVGCGAIKNADRQVNKMTDHGTSRGGSADVDGGPSPTTAADAGTDSGITSM